jgi:formylmethanofuran dehydrogenase subunit E
VTRSVRRQRHPGRFSLAVISVLAFLLLLPPARAETPEEWVQLGTRIHGFFGSFIPAGIRIGLDAKERLQAEPRRLSILYYQGEKAPCPCFLDGVMLAVQASPGQGTVKIAAEAAPAGALAVIIIRERKIGGAGLRYVIADEWLPRLLAWNKEEPLKRYEAAMATEGMFTVEPYPGP